MLALAPPFKHVHGARSRVRICGQHAEVLLSQHSSTGSTGSNGTNTAHMHIYSMDIAVGARWILAVKCICFPTHIDGHFPAGTSPA
jgi:hypothetical protein